MIKRIIPSSGEPLPVIGLGTWQTFDCNAKAYPKLTEVLNTMQHFGGSVIDSSPMYGKAETVVGDITSAMATANDFFYATKVWIHGRENGILQIKESMQKMHRTTMDLVQVHNLTDWQTHLPYLQQLKKEGITRYTGITHYRDSSHGALEQIIATETIDFVQFNYSVANRNAENRLLQAAADKGVATIINRPFGEGRLFDTVKKRALPEWAVAAGISNWAAFFLSYIIAHPAVTCVIPATGNPLHAADNFSAAQIPLPEAALRIKMAQWIDELL